MLARIKQVVYLHVCHVMSQNYHLSAAFPLHLLLSSDFLILVGIFILATHPRHLVTQFLLNFNTVLLNQ